jgi:hypothetical protein
MARRDRPCLDQPSSTCGACRRAQAEERAGGAAASRAPVVDATAASKCRALVRGGRAIWRGRVEGARSRRKFWSRRRSSSRGEAAAPCTPEKPAGREGGLTWEGCCGMAGAHEGLVTLPSSQRPWFDVPPESCASREKRAATTDKVSSDRRRARSFEYQITVLASRSRSNLRPRRRAARATGERHVPTWASEIEGTRPSCSNWRTTFCSTPQCLELVPSVCSAP